jgi:hypothetical protein
MRAKRAIIASHRTRRFARLAQDNAFRFQEYVPSQVLQFSSLTFLIYVGEALRKG